VVMLLEMEIDGFESVSHTCKSETYNMTAVMLVFIEFASK
jgi:hypothetical protein